MLCMRHNASRYDSSWAYHQFLAGWQSTAMIQAHRSIVWVFVAINPVVIRSVDVPRRLCRGYHLEVGQAEASSRVDPKGKPHRHSRLGASLFGLDYIILQRETGTASERMSFTLDGKAASLAVDQIGHSIQNLGANCQEHFKHLRNLSSLA